MNKVVEPHFQNLFTKTMQKQKKRAPSSRNHVQVGFFTSDILKLGTTSTRLTFALDYPGCVPRVAFGMVPPPLPQQGPLF
jgi:hypothetical protein